MAKLPHRMLPVILLSIVIRPTLLTRILGIFCLPSLSHQLVYRVLMEELANVGHDIVTVTTNPAHYNMTFKGSITEIDVETCSYKVKAAVLDRSKFTPTPSFIYKFYTLHEQFNYVLSKSQLEQPEVRALIENKTEHFDLIFIQSCCQIYYPIAYHFNAPYIIFSTTMEMLPDLRVSGKPYNPIFYPSLISNYIGPINFWEKIDALCFYLWQNYFEWYYSMMDNELVKKYIGSNLPSIEDAFKQVSLLFLNISPITGGIIPNVPSAVYLEGIHIRPKKELPKELKSYLDNSTQGVIYMSLGTNTKSATISADIVSIFINVFAQLPYNVIWKWEAETLPGKPENVLTSKWFPQSDLLAHKNVKAFITQGGQHSLDEAIVNKVPIIGIPVAIDQHRNIRHMVNLGVCKRINFLTIDEESLRNAIIKIVEEKRYHTNMQRLSTIVYDKQHASLQTAVWWTEHILRNKKPIHLHAPVMSFWEYLMVDFILLLLLFAAIVIIVVKILCGKLYALFLLL